MKRSVAHKIPTVGEEIAWAKRGVVLSQAQFASRFGFATASVKNWEQGRTKPEGPAKVLLAVIAKHPEAVEDALRPAS